VCLVLGAAGLVTAAAAASITVAHRWAVDAVRTNARATVGVMAARHAARVESVIDARRRSLDDFMVDVRSQCGYVLEGGGTLWNLPCLAPLVRDFHSAQGALGVQVIRGPRPVLQFGTPVSLDVPPAGSPELPILIPGPEGPPRYQLRGIDRGLVLVAEYALDEVAAALAANPQGLGSQAWLVGEDGRVLALPAGDTVPGGSVAPCTGADVDGEAPAPGGPGTLRAMRPVPGLDACVEARLPLAPELAAADALRASLWRIGIIFAAVAAFAGYLASRWVAVPARRLLAAVAGVSRGEADPAIVPSGPSELQALGAAMHSLSSDVSRHLSSADTARREAEAASAAKDHFVAMLSQELRTLVTTVNDWIHDIPGTRASGR
jgi:hypothetical protein